ncbi:pyridoxamine 5'-phosphate oxidase family protein [Mumia sp. ZJ1417]|uniref:pyridoxamine 5'-phosphate oxidase family protein n=1 Tax=Mumia sp. ZJ1417 TaxID=2708082 RepID=UPI001FBAAA83|nr:pyridoxamine 5'-phosphate oxidase family protein [Mumia sp. ZJ1417]
MSARDRHVPEPGEDLPDPLDLLASWLGPVPGAEPPLMTLATREIDGAPDARTVMVNGCNGERISFHSDSRARKVAQLTAYPYAVGVLVWPEEARQLVVAGATERATDDEAARLFEACPRDLQLLAWLNDPRLARLPREERQEEWRRFDEAHPVLVPPPTWLCFHLVPQRLTFWAGDDDGPSTRCEARREGDDWTVHRLPG